MKPSALQRLAGNPSKRSLADRESEPSGPLGGPPAWLSVDALDEWRRVVPDMERLGVFTHADYSAVVAHCIVYGEVVGAAKRGEAMKVASLTALRLSAAELGLTPTSRAKPTGTPGPKNEAAEDFFSKPPALVR